MTICQQNSPIPARGEKWTPADLRAEHDYIFNERLGLMTDGRPATERQGQPAKVWADEHCERVRRG